MRFKTQSSITILAYSSWLSSLVVHHEPKKLIVLIQLGEPHHQCFVCMAGMYGTLKPTQKTWRWRFSPKALHVKRPSTCPCGTDIFSMGPGCCLMVLIRDEYRAAGHPTGSTGREPGHAGHQPLIQVFGKSSKPNRLETKNREANGTKTPTSTSLQERLLPMALPSAPVHQQSISGWMRSKTIV